MNIVVLAGGLSPERDVSLSSGSLISNALMKKGHKVLLVDLFKGLKDTETFENAYSKYGKSNYQFVIPETEPDLDKLVKEAENKGLIGLNVISICQSADIVFLALHGDIGENGKLQAIFDAFDIAYTGTGYTGSLLAMNKIVAKEIMSFHGIHTPEWVVCDTKNQTMIPFLPCVVKPISCGSSVGVSIVESENSFRSAIEYAAKYESEILLERKIQGREFSVGVLNQNPLPVIEIIPKQGFYDYKNKYQSGLATEICPADIDNALSLKLQECALIVHRILKLGTYSRVDFMLSNDGIIYCLEANTLPGMTPTSLLPQEAQAIGISYEDLCEQIVILSFHDANNALQ